ncbi:hypothetical protein CR513_47950, partial [Mucuna pruriens]
MDRNMVNAVSWGALMDKTLAATRHLILNTSKIGKPIDGAHISSEVTRCQLASTSRATSMWDLCLGGAPY